jgi:hypothetical protein
VDSSAWIHTEGGTQACYLMVDPEPLTYFCTVRWRKEEMAPQAEMHRNGTVRREKALGMPWGVTPP